MKSFRAPAFVLLAGTLWGSMGLFVRLLNAAGLRALEVAQLRFLLSAVFVGLYLLIFHRDRFRIRVRDLWCFLGTGLCSLLSFSWCYFTGLSVASLSVMSVLLYTAPIFVMLLSCLLFHERLTAKKLLALAMSVGGCVLVSGLGGAQLGLNGLLLGLGAGFSYALYSIFGRFAINRGYGSWTITFYSFLVCALGCAFLADWRAITAIVLPDASLLGWSAALALFTGFLPYILYTMGLEGMPPSRASILASIEPVTATVLGTLVFHEPLSLAGIAGIVLVLGAIAVLSVRSPQQAENE